MIHFSGTGTCTFFHATTHGVVSCPRLFTSLASGVGKNDFTLFTVFHGSSVAHTTISFAILAGAFTTACPAFVTGNPTDVIFNAHSIESAKRGLLALKSSHHFANSAMFSCCPVASTSFFTTGDTTGSIAAHITSDATPPVMSHAYASAHAHTLLAILLSFERFSVVVSVSCILFPRFVARRAQNHGL